MSQEQIPINKKCWGGAARSLLLTAPTQTATWRQTRGLPGDGTHANLRYRLLLSG